MSNKFDPPASVTDASHPRFVLHRQLEREFGIGWCNVHLLRLEKEGKFPARHHLGKNTVAWLHSDIVNWVRKRVAQRSNAAPPQHSAIA